jgi:hypothetical protein
MGSSQPKKVERNCSVLSHLVPRPNTTYLLTHSRHRCFEFWTSATVRLGRPRNPQAHLSSRQKVTAHLAPSAFWNLAPKRLCTIGLIAVNLVRCGLCVHFVCSTFQYSLTKWQLSCAVQEKKNTFSDCNFPVCLISLLIFLRRALRLSNWQGKNTKQREIQMLTKLKYFGITVTS